MDRSPLDDSHGDAPPASPGGPADERSVRASELPPTEASPYSPPATGTDRPAGRNHEPARAVLDPIPPPPPPPPTRQTAGSGPNPPTHWSQPPTAANPPRPADTAPLTAGGVAPIGPPSSPPPAPTDGSPPLDPKRRGWRVAAGVFLAFVMALSLVAGGFALGSVLSDDSGNEAPAATGTLRPAAIDDLPEEDGPGLEAVPGPLADEESEEPVADVARVVAPSVVRVLSGIGQGSGIVWDAANGYIVTNDHVVGNSSTVEVQFGSGATTTGDVIGGDDARDIAVIQVDATDFDLVEAVFAPGSTVEVGQLAVAIGSPFGLDQTVTAGIVSAINRVEPGGSDASLRNPVEFIQTDAPINPGNSGGALADRQGRVIGMNTQIRTSGTSDGNVGVGFAVPSDTIVLIAQRIIDGEPLDLAFLGIEGVSPTDGSIGAIVVRVIPDTPADSTGLVQGDLIVGFDRKVISTWEELTAEVRLYRPGDTVEIEVVRDGERLVSEVTLTTPD